MKRKKGISYKKQLRERAEELLKKSPEAIENLLPEDIGNLIEELHVHQIELEMQNDELRRAQVELEEARSKYFELYDAAPVGYFVFDETGLILDVNLTGARLLGFERLYLAKRPFLGLVMSKDQRQFNSHLGLVFETKVKQACELELLKKDGKPFYAQLESIAVEDAEGRFKQCRTAVLDVALRKRAEEALRASEERYRSYIELTEQLGWTSNAHGEVVEDIPTWRRFTGQSKEAAMGWGWSKALHPDDLERTAQIWRKAVSTRSEYEAEYRVRRHDGIYRHFLARGVPVFKADGSVREWVGTCIDITERKQAEKQIQESLREKEVLLKEIHHRVKNNLQTIASLLNMSSMQTQNEEAKGLLQEARAKVFTMALIHTQLYQEKQFNQIDMGKHVGQLINHLEQTYTDKEKGIRTVVEPSDVRLPINQAIPCGLVLNELVSNAFKHAFEDKHDGKIDVSLRYIESGMVGIKVKDDGIGIPEDVDTGKPKTLGLELVNALVKQLGGTVQFKHDGGTEVNIQFKALEEEEADA